MWVNTQSSDWNSANTPCSPHQALINDIWWKAASLVVQRESWNEDLIIDPLVIKVQDTESWDFEAPSDNNKKIVRGSASGDERGLVDSLVTLKNVDARSISSGLQRRINIDEIDQSVWNPLALRMYQSWLWLQEIADALWIDSSVEAIEEILQRTAPWYNRPEGKINSWDLKLLIDEHVRDSEVPYISPFLMMQAPLWIEFGDEDRRILEYGSLEENPLLRVINASRRDWVIEHAKRWDGLEDYTWVSSVVVQDMVHGNTRGSIIEHPNLEWHHLINLIREKDGRFISQFLVNHKGEVVSKEESLFAPEVPVTVEEILHMKVRSRKAWFIDEAYSSQVEFGFQWDSLKFFQERRFLPFDFRSDMGAEGYSFNRFGNPEQHGELRVVNLADPDLDPTIFTDWVPSVYIPTQGMIGRRVLFPGFFPNNMKAILIWGQLIGGPHDLNPWHQSNTAGANSIEHNTYRYILKAWSALMDKSDYRIWFKKTGEMIQL